MKYESAIPSNTLQPYIKRYWALENVPDKDKKHSQRIIATGLPELIFYFGNRPRSDKRDLEGNALLSGQQNDFYDLVITDKLSMFAITFQANGLSSFLKTPINELQNQIVPLDSIDKIFSQHLEQQLAAVTTFEKRIEIVEVFFLKLLNSRMVPVDYERMANAIKFIKSTKGHISIDTLASETCLSRKQFERKFLSHIGISPKQFLKIIRFQNAIFLKQSTAKISLTELAYATGYYDQSHFINEIKSLTGQTPKELFKSGAVISDFFQ